MKTCEDCGCRVYSLGCVNCDEDAYIEQQESFDAERERSERQGELIEMFRREV